MTLADELKARGYGREASAPLETILSAKRGVYLGIDPTADSMHVGNLVPIILMRRLAQAGHRAVFLVGGGTGMIGDPRDSGERSLLDKRTLEHNKRALRSQLQKIVGRRIELVDNATWLSKVGLLEFLRDIGKHFTVNELTKRELIKRRLETPNESISFTEFSYALLQGYDFLTLYRKKGIDVQIGASDQWTNMLSGVELIRRKFSQEAHCFTCPLVTDATGKKFGKSEGNAIWLDARKTSPYDLYQFWIRLPDAKLDEYLKLYTFLSLEEIEGHMQEHAKNPGARHAQKLLAAEVTRIVHGEKALRSAIAASEAAHGATKDVAELKKHLAEVVTVRIGDEMKVVDALVASGLATSKNEARRLIEGKGVKVNDVAVLDIHAKLDTSAVGDMLLVRGTKSSVVSIVK
ncbi:MAG TPA: tyrosine--tRNA ligase [Candidatus Paceibacterota bacterium]|nr:tyrosine--tRNA ligase [Candidatus Paceibacterota bacterium]